MSLKAKLEAVIYAAEEPVTLAQLSVLFADDAFAWKAEQAAAAAEQAAADAAEPLPLETAGLTYEELTGQADPVPAELVVEEELSEESPEPDLEAEEAETAAAEQAPGAEPGAVDNAAAETEARRLARQRDKEARGILRRLLDELIAESAADGRGIEIREIAGGYRMATKPECHDAVRSFVKSLKPVLKLSLPALETLAVVAYKQPVTAPEVNEIRGVDSSGVFGSLLARKLITTAGRKPVIGRPILYKTTREFLLRFGLKDVSELPSMEEFEKMAATELDEPEMDAAAAKAAAARPEFDEAASEETDGASADSAEPTPAEAEPAAPPPQQPAETE